MTTWHASIGALLLAGVAVAAPAPDKDNATARGVLLPIGVADAAGKVGFVPNDKQGIDAIDLANGETLWQTTESNKPLLAIEKRLVVWAPVKDKPHEIRLVVLDTSDKGKKVLESNPIELPEWVGIGGYGRSFAAKAILERGAVIVTWEAHARYAGGAAPTPEILKAATKDATGAARVNLENGKVETVDLKKLEESGAKLPESLEKVKSRQYWTGSDWKTTPFVFADKASVLEGESAKDQEKMSLKIYDLASGKEKETVKLLEGKSLWPQLTLDGRHLFVHQAVVKEQLPEGDFAWWVFELDTGKQVGKLPYVQSAGIAVVGDHAFYLVTQPRKGGGGPGQWTQPRALQAVNLKTGKVDWEHGVEPLVFLPPPP
jgi:hypothetical protein